MTPFTVNAEPGYFVIDALFEDDGTAHNIDKIPVIGWRVDEAGITWPVTIFNVQEGGIEPNILCPDGRVMRFNESWQCVAEWLEHEVAA